MIGGDSAGAQIAAQIGALVTTPGYADAVGVTPTITPVQLRGLVLACGQYDVQLPSDVSTAAGRKYFHTVLWAYSGKRNFLDDPAFATLSVAEHVTSAFPPALLTVGNVDPLRPHSERLFESCALRELSPRRCSIPMTTSRRSTMSTNSTSTPTPANCSSSARLRFCSCACNRQRMRR